MSERKLPFLTPLQTLAFFASVIKSGEQWTPTCQQAYDEGKAALAASRSAILEEAAKVADAEAQQWTIRAEYACAVVACENVAAAIRSLSTQGDGR
jgi:hypothetical protein